MTDFVGRERIERREAREDMMKMIGIAISQLANAMTSNNNNNNNVSAFFTPRQAPRFEGLNEERITLCQPPPP